jgi:hypothetical protein
MAPREKWYSGATINGYLLHDAREAVCDALAMAVLAEENRWKVDATYARAMYPGGKARIHFNDRETTLPRLDEFDLPSAGPLDSRDQRGQAAEQGSGQFRDAS